MTGIYVIENQTKSKLYFGSASNVHKQIATIRKNLKTNKFHIESLQTDFNNNDKFEFSYIKCKNSELNSQKYKLIHKHNTCDPKFGYNRSLPKDWCKLIENGYLQNHIDIDLNDKVNSVIYEPPQISIDDMPKSQITDNTNQSLILEIKEIDKELTRYKTDYMNLLNKYGKLLTKIEMNNQEFNTYSIEYNELMTKYSELDSKFMTIKTERDTYYNFINGLKSWEM